MRVAWVLAALSGIAAGEDVPKPNPRLPPSAWAKTLQKHPRLLGPPEHLQKLAAEKPQLWKELEKNGRDGRSLLEAGLVYAATGGENADAAKKYVAETMISVGKGVTNEHQDTWIALTNAALAYDLLHGAFSAEERKRVIEWMNGHLGAFTEDEGAFHNSTMPKILAYLRIAYGTQPENPRAKEFRDHALAALYERRVAPVMREFGEGGGFTEAGWYLRGCLWSLVEALELARRFEGYDGFAKAPEFWYSRIAYEMFNACPGTWTYGAERYPHEGDGSIVYGGAVEFPRHARRVLAQHWRGSELARFLSEYGKIHPKGSNVEARLQDFLWDEGPEPQPLPMESFELSHIAAGIGKVFARSDWTDDATWLRFEAGDYFAGHQHFDCGNFEVFRRESLATESGEYDDYGSPHAMNWYTRTIAHNCVLVFDPSERSWKDMRDGGRVEYLNDGGQTKTWEWTKPTLEEWLKKRDQFDRADIVAYEGRREFMFVAADCTRAYSREKLRLWVRQLLFVRPHTVVVLDRVVSTRADFRKTWLLHCKDEPDTGDAKELSPGELEGAGDRATIRAGKGVLHVQCLLPEKRRLRRVGGKGVKDYWVNDRNVAPRNEKAPDENPRWRIEVIPAEAREEDVFLHLLSTEAAPQASVVRAGARVTVRLGGGVEATFDLAQRAGGEVKFGGTKVPLKPEIRRGRWE